MAALEHFTPIVRRRWLFLAAALLWAAAGAMLCVRAAAWYLPAGLGAIPWELVGLAGGVIIYRFKFAWIADRNIKRIRRLRERESILAFQSPAMYVVIACMMGAGIALRHSAIPRLYLAVLYSGIGLGLLLASPRYIRQMGD